MKLAAVPQAGEKCEKKEMWPTNLKIEIVRSRVWNATFGEGGCSFVPKYTVDH
jgi:hypothetical protein